MNTTQRPPELEQAVQAIAKGIEPIINDIHKNQPTGRDYYPEYMVLIQQMKEARPTVPVSFWGIVLLKAGCNVNGVEAAIKLS